MNHYLDKNWISLNIDLLEIDKERFDFDDDTKNFYPHQAWINLAEIPCMFINMDGNLIIRLSNSMSFVVKKLEEIKTVQRWLEERTFE